MESTIYLIGDSTCQTNYSNTYPQVGWGQVFPAYIKKEYKVVNLAKNGCSTKSFIDQNRFKKVEENITKNDLLFIQFGHNDKKINDESRYAELNTTYVNNLEYFIDVALSKGAIPVILSSISRREFRNNKLINTHEGYDKKAIELAKKKKIHYVDLSTLTFDYLNSLGDEESKKLFMNFEKNKYKNYINGLSDNTHLRIKGAKKICELIRDSLINTDLKDIFV